MSTIADNRVAPTPVVVLRQPDADRMLSTWQARSTMAFDRGLTLATTVAGGVFKARERTFSVEIDAEAGCVTAVETVTGIFGAGATIAEAFADLGTAIKQHREALEERDNLSVRLAEQLEYLRGRLATE